MGQKHKKNLIGCTLMFKTRDSNEQISTETLLLLSDDRMNEIWIYLQHFTTRFLFERSSFDVIRRGSAESADAASVAGT